ncbi:probable calcium-binding protein CML10 [Phalaenopsis equestris]|uniref:probable calcium-binding protein CML10 n=1 Tax=Phalaenopsis equestris TaxID=78828 RepID=UPI0009E4122A|nr:probable calcium-binding protein CML10 [Phalaenopsis equestris]
MGKLRSLLRRRRRSKGATSNGEASEPASPEATPTAATTREELERVFRKFDSNGDGKISSSELGAIFESLGHPASDEELAGMMNEVDADGDGFISLEEFVDLNTSEIDSTAALEDLRHAFSVFDLDRNGSISAEELARVMRGLGEGVSVAQCRKMIDGVDQDGDGLISFEEFKVMMSKSPIATSITKIE